MKYLFIELEIQDGEREHTHRVLETTKCKNIHFAAEYYAAHYWGYGERTFGDDAWFAHGGEIAIKCTDVRELSEYEYKLLDKLFYSANDKKDNYFNIVHAGYRKEYNREEIQIHAGKDGNIFLYPTDKGFVIDVYGQGDIVKTMEVSNDELS